MVEHLPRKQEFLSSNINRGTTVSYILKLQHAFVIIYHPLLVLLIYYSRQS